ncbi:hypothetical protein B0H14DRAFT_3859896 [Mycena olivaceomarginata]|nr:hypothetical protein B0H14DRAFT_3859896 [Mycena olivaceomarginata]
MAPSATFCNIPLSTSVPSPLLSVTSTLPYDVVLGRDWLLFCRETLPHTSFDLSSGSTQTQVLWMSMLNPVRLHPRKHRHVLVLLQLLREPSKTYSPIHRRDYRDVDGTLIAPHELYSKLTEGSLVLLTVSFATYLMANPGRKTRKVYHVLVDRLKILDHGDGDAWDPPVPALPEPLYSPATPKRRRDDAADAAFDSFGSKSSPSPAKKSRRTTTSTK